MQNSIHVKNSLFLLKFNVALVISYCISVNYESAVLTLPIKAVF